MALQDAARLGLNPQFLIKLLCSPIELPFYKHIDSVIVSHVLDGATLFFPDPFPEDQLQGFIAGNLPPNSTPQLQLMTDLFKSLYESSTEDQRLLAVYTSLLLTCNLRVVLKAYSQSAWAFQSSFKDCVINGMHGNDMPATWYDPDVHDYNGTASEFLFSPCQRYLTNHELTGNPNGPYSSEFGYSISPTLLG
ncbi:hypothetical protein BJX64DRAFT_288310 [Aspergillus heterothallicus]